MMQTQQSAGAERADSLVWIDATGAVVARRTDDGALSTLEIERGDAPEERHLGTIVHELVDGRRVMVIGEGAFPIALERRFVEVSHRPDRLIAPHPRLFRRQPDSSSPTAPKAAHFV